MLRTSGTPNPARPENAPVYAVGRATVGTSLANPYYTKACIEMHPNTAVTGCMHCCDACNYDRHQCFGCGEPVPHGHYSCPECDEAHNVEEKEGA